MYLTVIDNSSVTKLFDLTDGSILAESGKVLSLGVPWKAKNEGSWLSFGISRERMGVARYKVFLRERKKMGEREKRGNRETGKIGKNGEKTIELLHRRAIKMTWSRIPTHRGPAGNPQAGGMPRRGLSGTISGGGGPVGTSGWEGAVFPFLLMLHGKVETRKRRSAANVVATSNENLWGNSQRIPKCTQKIYSKHQIYQEREDCWYWLRLLIEGRNKEKEKCSVGVTP